MKLFKSILLSSIILSVFFYFFFLIKHNKKKLSEPISFKNNFYSKLENELLSANLKPAALKIFDFNDKVEFYLDQTKIILSSKKESSKQITSLQEILKIGRIKDKQIKIIDLSIDHPYATFKNN